MGIIKMKLPIEDLEKRKEKEKTNENGDTPKSSNY